MPELRKSYGVSSISVFGSVARGEERPESDVDLIVEFEKTIGLFKFMALKSRLEDLLGCAVDVGTAASLRDRARDQALKEAIRVA